MGFVQRWFGFNGWKEMSTRGNIVASIMYRIIFVAGLAAAIMTYTFASGGQDPSAVWICVVGLVWFLAFQFMVNLVFVNGSR